MDFVNVSSLKNEDELKKKIENIYSLLSNLDEMYPDFKDWFNNKVVLQLNGKKREIITIENELTNEIMGLVILKNTEYEKKICTLKVFEEHQNKGFGRILIHKAIQFLGTTSPMITIPVERKKEFESLINEFEFNLEESHDYYRQGKPEYVYNGRLTVIQNKEIANEIQYVISVN